MTTVRDLISALEALNDPEADIFVALSDAPVDLGYSFRPTVGHLFTADATTVERTCYLVNLAGYRVGPGAPGGPVGPLAGPAQQAFVPEDTFL